MVSGVNWTFFAYVSAYGIATLGCLFALRRAVRIEDAETRYGLVGLLIGSGGWAALELGFLLVPSAGLKRAAYTASLVVGLSTILAWLYFCSAYTGRTFHRNRTYRRVAVGAYLAIVAVKLTNPIHGWYFTTAFVTEPFTHLTIQHGTLHWVVTGLSYALVSIGFFMLFELFLEADYDTRALGGVAGVTAIPVVLDVVGFASDRLIDINYEPLGVVVFAIGVLYVFEERFLAVQLTDGVDDAVVYLDDDDRIRDFNDRARSLLACGDCLGEPIETALPDVAESLGEGESIVEREHDGETRYYLASDTSFTLGQAEIGRIVVFTDVTETERQRRELERQNEQLEGFATAIRHELLNTLQIVDGRVAAAGQALEDGDVGAARESLRTASETADRMATIVDDLSTLARRGQTLEATRPVPFRRAVEDAWRVTTADGLSLSIEGDGEIEAEASRLRDLLGNAFEFADHNGASSVTVALWTDGFAITGDGDPPGDADPEQFFEYGGPIPGAEAGMTLPNLRNFARVHGWETTIDTDYQNGVRIVVSGATVERARAEAD